MKRFKIRIICFAMCFATQLSQNTFAQLSTSVSKKNKSIVITSNSIQYNFTGEFSILYSSINPDVALRPAGIKDVLYNVPTWAVADESKADLKHSERENGMFGDGFDDKILKGSQSKRTPNLYNAGKIIIAEPIKVVNKKDSVVFVYPSNKYFSLSAVVVFHKNNYPKIKYILSPKQKGYFSIGYTGAPAIKPSAATEIWQPLVWQEKRFPDNAYLTPSFMATLPTTFVNDGKNSIGVLASPEYIPFDPLPVFENSQFGISVRDREGMAKPQVFAPILGSQESLMTPGKQFSFSAYLVVEPKSITYTYEYLARKYFGFKDYRKNDISTLNNVFDNIIDYSMSHYAWFVDSLKGFAYSTDVPEAVKNVSSLHPIELALVTDNPAVFEKRAYPLLEYMLSREKFLFALDSTQKIQSPSRKLRGPIAPISELTALYDIFGKANPFYLKFQKKEYNTNRIRNWDVMEKGDTWITSMNMYKSTRDEAYLKKAIDGANDYLANRVDKEQTAFSDEFAGGFFFWPAYTIKWIDLLELYELTKDKKYLTAAHDGARHYTMFTWMVPAIPKDSLITVNKDGKAPLYDYLKSKGHKQMYLPEEKAPTWRLSEIGLTPESSGTSTGHRAIFMANYAPWMLRLGYYTNDSFLKEVAKAAIIGRYRNFPGYHINTARTTAYEKFNFPMHEHKEQSVNSFHYNHIMPMASMLLDYLVTDAYVRSLGQIEFPSEFIEGYAYLQDKFYGAAKGKLYDEENINLWMPERLLKTSNIELNYISGRRGDEVFIAFTNQSEGLVNSTIDLNKNILKLTDATEYFVYKNGGWEKAVMGKLNVTVPPNGITVIRLKHVNPIVKLQNEVLEKVKSLKNDYAQLDFGNAEAMIICMGTYATKAYIYLKDDDTKFSEVSIQYQLDGEKPQTITRKVYPFEFTIELPLEKPYISFKLEGVKVNGEKISGNTVNLGGYEDRNNKK